MRASEFHTAVADEFGEAYGRVLLHDLVLTELDGRTSARALSDGEAPRTVWLALCRAADVPESRWYGVGLPKPRD